MAILITRLEGGAGVLALRGAEALDRDRFTPVIVTGSGDGTGSGDLLAAAAAAGLEVIVEPALRVPIAPRSDLTALGRLESLLRRLDADVVHTHCAKAGVIGRVAARRAGVARVVHTYHGFPFHSFQARPRRQAYIAVERQVGRLTDVALCVGAGVAAEAVRQRLVPPDRVSTIGVCVDGPDRARAVMSARDPQAALRARRALGLPPGAAVVGAVGRLTYQKAPDDFVAALAGIKRPGVIGVWIGDGEMSARVRRRIQLLAPGRVLLAGQRADVLQVLPALDVFALPSRYEGLPTAIVEAMICGVPVVATAVNAVPDLVIPGVTGMLVAPGQPAALAAAVRQLLDSPALAARLSDNAGSRVAGRFGQKALASALASAYAPAGGPARGPGRAAPRGRAGPGAGPGRS